MLIPLINNSQTIMSSHVNLIRMDSTSYTCCYGNDVYSYNVRCPENAIIFFPGDIQDSESKMYVFYLKWWWIGLNQLSPKSFWNIRTKIHFKFCTTNTNHPSIDLIMELWIVFSLFVRRWSQMMLVYMPNTWNAIAMEI